MCTVVVSFDPTAVWPVVMLGLRDEAVDRPWDPPGAWWPERSPSLRGVRDREAGGAWLAVDDATSRAAVVLNRHEDAAEPEGGFVTRGILPLDSVERGMPGTRRTEVENSGVRDSAPQEPTPRHPATRTFNLVEASPDGVSYTAWDGVSVVTAALKPGVHLVTHEGPDVASVPREVRWLPEFSAARRPDSAPGSAPGGSAPVSAPGGSAPGWQPWLEVLRRSAALPTDDPTALFRSDEIDGHRYASLSVSLLALRPGEVVLKHARLAHPGHLDAPLDWR